jgi:hypothetical protein
MYRVFALLGLAGSAAAAERQVDFQREIRPILSDACFHCHGPDKNTRLMGLRLDTREGAFETRKTGTVIVPGKPDASLLYRRIVHASDASRMPPPSSKKAVSAEQKALIRKWIEQGANWKEHWSFAAPSRPVPPKVRNAAWVRNLIDNFVLARLEGAKLAPATEADRRTIIRRVALDTTGLPPTPAEVEAFVSDKSANAYERMADRYLGSERFGEHRARYWLDAARYGDTHGIHVDNYREMWPYRDWVIQAFNSNLGFDRFTIEQIAGDLLPNRTQQQQIASGFHRCNVTTNEGGSIPEEVAVMYAKDRVDTTATVWLGLTAGCASCHDHKFDPISQRDFYQFAAFFRNLTQNPMDGNIPDTPPILFVPRAGDESRWAEAQAEAARLTEAKSERRRKAAGAFEEWAASRRLAAEPLSDSPIVKLDPSSVETAAGVRVDQGPTANRQALHFGAKATANIPAGGFNPDQPFTLATWVLMPKEEDSFVAASQSVASKIRRVNDDDDAAVSQGWAIEINARIPSLRLSAGGAIRATGNNINRLKPGEWTHLAFTYDGSGDPRGLALYVNGKPVVNNARNTAPLPILEGPLQTDAPIRLGGENRRYLNGGAVSDFRIYGRAIRPEEASILASWNRIEGADAPREALFEYYLTRSDGEYQELERRLEKAESERKILERRASITHVMEEKKETQPMANILYRGQYDQPRDAVNPNTPSVLPPMAASMARNRLGLAQWLVDPANPLTARVTVNRMWQELFGTGIVKTAEDFGSQGQAPSHPDLLDWLAVDFRESGWDMKRMYKQMLMSATYRQSAATNGEKTRVDPENRLLSRGVRYRMDAEMVRDGFLFAGGVLNPAVGGPSVRPYQPEGIWEAVAMKGSNTRFYKQDHGEGLYRRSMYTFWKRAAPPASMEIFNAPTRETCTVRRERTNTPLQALVTLNDPQMVEAARNLAQRALQSGRGFDARLDLITMRVISRPMNPRERRVVKQTVGDLLSHYDSKPEEARKLLGVGESKADAALSIPEFAAWTMVASGVLNLDEALNK